MSKKIGRNDPCWCGSGRKYKKCHLNREQESQLPFGAIRAQANRSAAYRTCLHPEASKKSCGKVISAHTLQRSRVLKAISEDNHVFSFHPATPDKEGKPSLHRIGWRRASTFSAFCDHHDSHTFAPLEDSSFSSSKLEAFLIGYRAICWELYQKITAMKQNPTIRDLLDRGMPESLQREVQEMLSVQNAGFEKGLEDLTRIKNLMDQSLLSQNYDNFTALEILLEGNLSIASTGAITPNITIGGNELQVLHDMQIEAEWLAFGVDVTCKGASIIFVWISDEGAPRRYLDEVLNLPSNLLPRFLAQFFFAHCENTYFSIPWWNSLCEGDQLFLQDLMANANPYYQLPSYDLDKAVAPWTYVCHREL